VKYLLIILAFILFIIWSGLRVKNRKLDEYDIDTQFKYLVISSLATPPSHEILQNSKRRYELACQILTYYGLLVNDIERLNEDFSQKKYANDPKIENVKALMEGISHHTSKNGPLKGNPHQLLLFILGAVQNYQSS